VEEAAQLQEQLRNQKLGDILLQNNVVTPEQLLEAIERQSKMPMVRIGDALVSLGLISDVQLKDALAQQKSDRDTPLGELLVRRNIVSPLDLQTALARKMGYPLVSLEDYPADAAALKKVPYQTALRLEVMPLLMLGDGRLVLAIDDPSRRGAALAEVEFVAQTKVVPVLAQCKDMATALFTAYSAAGATPGSKLDEPDSQAPLVFDTQGATELLETLEENDLSSLVQDDDRPVEQSDNSLVRLINTMIVEAYEEGSSDIHIESYPGREKIRIRFRKDGLLRTYMELPAKYRSAMVARIKIMCDLDISERRKPQDGKINFAKFSARHKIELRIATIPTNNNLEDVVMRILASAKPIPLDSIGLSHYNLEALKRAIERPYGMVLCVGPTGSGKTTTLHSALSHINVPERKIWTAEDPVEITQPGLRQVQVNPKIEWTFAKALRAFLRADPDVIMVGEIRDTETAHMAIEASLTGHLVMSTLHTNSAPETVTRLLDMGMDPFNFADSLLAVLAQRLVRRWCSHCLSSRPATEEEIHELLDDSMHAFGKTPAVSRDELLAGWITRHSQDGRLMHHHSPGCKECNHTGYKGRVGLHELMVVSREVRSLIQTGARAEQLQQAAMLEGMRCLRHDGIEKVWAGLTSIEEVRATSNV
jgi:type II secretory ATPase GspE/PulE/Tfp pilus assembly ATPase PilB-like protein